MMQQQYGLSDDEREQLKAYLMSQRAGRGRLGELESAEQAAMQSQANSQLLAGLGRAANQVGAAMAETKADNSAYDAIEQSAGAPLQRVRGALEQERAKRDMLASYLMNKRDKSQMMAAKQAQDEAMFARKMGREDQLLSDERAYKDRVRDDEQRFQLAKEAQDAETKRRDDALYVPGFGQALSKTDAKAAKDAMASFQKYRRMVSEMKALRDKHGGAEVWNRDDVSRGQQLAKAGLLELKNLAKLGVLSKSDEDIINQILPSNPLGITGTIYNDPIMAKLDGALKDADADFRAFMSTRNFPKEKTEAFIASISPKEKLEGAPGTAIADDGDKITIVKREYHKGKNKTRLTYSDGTVEVLDGRR